MKNFTFLALSIALTSSTFMHAKVNHFEEEKEKSLIEKISALHLSSLAAYEMEEQAKAAKIQKENATNLTNYQFTKVQDFFGPLEQLKVAYHLHDIANYGLERKNKCTITESTLSDLSLYCGDRETPEYHVFGSIDKTQTISGKVALQGLIAQPTYNVKKLKQRQDFIKLLTKDDALYNKLVATLESIAQHEGAFLSIARTMQVEIEKHYNSILFPWPFDGLNRNSFIMRGGIYWSSGLLMPLIPLTAALTSHFLISLIVYYRQDRNAGIVGAYLSQTPAFLLFLYTGIKNYPVMMKLKSKMKDVASTLVKTHNDLAQTLAAMPQAKALLPDLEANVLSNLSEKESKEILNLLNNLEQSSFLNEGLAAAAFARRDELVKGNFHDSYKFLGLIDAYTSIATLMRENKESDATGRYCFAQYDTTATTPSINLKSFWHPMLDPATVVTNDITLGCQGIPANGIITGPNAGGKTTTIRSICLAVLLASTVGVVPAEQATITPFHNIATYLNVADSEGRESLFQAEMRRAQSLLNAIKGLNPNQFSFVIMDELLTGTNPKDAVAAIRGITERLSSFANSSILMTTHFAELATLEETKKFVNYKVSVDRINGKFSFPYKLEYGITDQSIVLELLANSGFDKEILEIAQNYANRQ